MPGLCIAIRVSDALCAMDGIQKPMKNLQKNSDLNNFIWAKERAHMRRLTQNPRAAFNKN